MRTWQVELAIVTAVLLVVAGASGGGAVELVGAAAVVLSFAHAQVADRLAEGEHLRRSYYRDEVADTHAVHCYRWAARYFVGKEALWCCYFIALHSSTALAGVALFLAYPLWRRWWRTRRA